MTSSDGNRHRKNSRKTSKEIYKAIQDYSEYSTIQGVVHIFSTNQKTVGKIFWILTVVSLLILGTYWSISAYYSWQDDPVLTTVKTSAYPVTDIEFPAVTICGHGSNMDILTAGFFNLFFNYLKSKKINLGVSPLKAAVIMRKLSYQVSTNNLSYGFVLCHTSNNLQMIFWY